MGIDKDLRSGDTFVYRAALVSLLARNRPVVETLSGDALREILSAAIGRDQMAKRVEPAVEIVKKWLERAKKIQAKTIR